MIETKPVLSTRKIQFLCLLAAGILELLMIVIGPTFQLVTKSYLIVPCAVFLGVTLVTDRERLAMRPLVMGAVVVLWCMIARNLQDTQGGFLKILQLPGVLTCWHCPLRQHCRTGKSRRDWTCLQGVSSWLPS